MINKKYSCPCVRQEGILGVDTAKNGLYPVSSRIGGPKSRSEPCGEEADLLPPAGDRTTISLKPSPQSSRIIVSLDMTGTWLVFRYLPPI